MYEKIQLYFLLIKNLLAFSKYPDFLQFINNLYLIIGFFPFLFSFD